MQNKGTITLFAILLAIASIYQLSFTFVTWGVKNKAEQYAGGDFNKEREYIDSVANKKAYPLLGFSFKECQKRELNLGLDLKGGMNVILEVSVVDLVKELSGNSTDATFNKAINLARENQRNSQDDFITLFYKAFKSIDPNAKLNAIFGTYELKDRIKPSTTDDEVLVILRGEANDAIDNSLNVLRSRIDRFGVIQPNIQKLEGNSGRILIELPGIKDPKRVRKLLQGTADLQFWATYYYPEVYSYFLAANEKLKEIKVPKKVIATDSTIVADSTKSSLTGILTDSTSKNELLNFTKDSVHNELANKEGYDKLNEEYPLFAVLNPYLSKENQPMNTAAVGFAHFKDTAKVNQIMNLKQIKALFPRDLVLAWEVKPFDDNEELYRLIALKAKRGGAAALSGDVVTSAREETDPSTGEWQVSMSMNAEGSQEWARVTKENKGRQVAILLDGYVYSFPVVNQEITGGRSSISGDFSQEESKDLSNILKSGRLQAPSVIIEEEVVGPSLGQEAVDNGMLSFALAFMFVLVYMVFFYKSSGIVSDIALIANIFFIFGVLASLGAVLTLPGIAGIVLTIGMSVDANVIIYERIKEELAAGKGIKLAVSEGYGHAYSAIIDANITTFITGLILYVFGHGPIKGFASTLMIGILTSLFSAIFITRIIFVKYLEKNKEITFYTKYTKNFLQNVNFDFMSKRKVGYVISSILIVLSIGSLLINGLNLGVDFKGGRTYVVKFDQEVKTTEVANLLKDAFGEIPEVKIYGKANQVKIITKYMVDSKEANSDNIAEEKLFNGLKPLFKAGITFDEFLDNHRESSQKVGPTIADDIKVAAIWSIFFALMAIFIYIFIRFKDWQFGLGAVAALAHDVIIVLGIFSMFYAIMPFSLEINQAFIAAILTVVGYSVNDTVIIFDRIREFLGLTKTRDRKELYNDALNSTLSRTFNTSMSTFIVLLSIFVFGGEVIRGFIFALLVGIVVGTYSSLFIATPVVFDTIRVKALDDNKISSTKEYLGSKKAKS